MFYKGLENSNIYEPKVNLEKNIPVFVAKMFSTNKKINSEKIFTGDKFYLMNIWASWCAPCRKEHKNLIRLSKNKNLKIIGVNFKDDEINAKQFLQEMGNPFYILTKDSKGKKSVNFGVYGIPETILVNPELIILKKYIGPLSSKDVNEIGKLIKK